MQAAYEPEPTLTVCIPTYRRSHLVCRAIDSVLLARARAGAEGEVEVLVVDDASSDRTVATVKAHPQHGKSFRFESRTVNLGMSANLMSMLKDEMRGEFALILSDDDILTPSALVEVLEVLRRGDRRRPGVVWTPRVCFTDDGAFHCVVCDRFDRNMSVGPSPAVAGRCMGCASVLSGLVLRRDAIDFAFWKDNIENAYFPVIVAGEIMTREPSHYLAVGIVRHTVLNKTHWERWGSSAVDIDARLFADFQAAYVRVREKLSPLNGLRFSVGAMGARADLLARYAMNEGGLQEYLDERGLGALKEVFRRAHLPEGLALPMSVAGRAARTGRPALRFLRALARRAAGRQTWP